MIELLDLPDELILAIMNKVKPRVLLLCSIVGIGNDRLEQLAIGNCHSIDLTFDYRQSSHEQLMERFYSHVLPRIYNNIQSLVFTFQHLLRISAFAEENCDGTFPNLTHLKMMIPRKCSITGTTFTLGNMMFSLRHDECLFAILPQLFSIETIDSCRKIPAFLCSRFMRSVISFELDEDCMLPTSVNYKDLFFPESSPLTHIRITLRYFNDCVRLLNQLGAQLRSFDVSFTDTNMRQYMKMSRTTSISCPYLKELTIRSYRNIRYYNPFVVPLLQSLTTVEYLTLLLAVGVAESVPRHFIDGYDLQKEIISYMPHLRQFHFHIRSILAYASPIDIDRIRQSFVHQEQSVDCVLDYFNNRCGQCQIFSLPFIGTRLDFISNRFPLFDENKNTFSNVTKILLFDDVKPFEYNFFRLISRALPHLESLEVFNRLEQEEKIMITTNLIEFPHLTTLILDDIHIDYAEQFLCRTHLPCLIELLIHYEPLSTIITQHPEEARNNCSRIEFLYFIDVSTDPTDPLLNFFPKLHCKLIKST